MNDDTARELLLALRELAARIDYWGEEHRNRMVDILRAENNGWRVKHFHALGGKMENRQEWKDLKAWIVERLREAPSGMLRDEVREACLESPHANLATYIASKRNVVNPLAQLEKEHRVFVSEEPRIKRYSRLTNKVKRYWAREHYLRHYAQFSDAQQQALVEVAVSEAHKRK